MRFSNFGDLVCISTTRNGNEDFLYIAMLTAGFATCLLELGYPVRGGIALGLLYHEDDVIVGPALDKALLLESQTAKYARIIFDPDIPMSSSPTSWVLKDDDNCLFLDFLDAGLLEMYNTLVLSEEGYYGEAVPQSFQIPVQKWQSYVPEFAVNPGDELPDVYRWLLKFLEERQGRLRS
jgi:hypothetical protein